MGLTSAQTGVKTLDELNNERLRAGRPILTAEEIGNLPLVNQSDVERRVSRVMNGLPVDNLAQQAPAPPPQAPSLSGQLPSWYKPLGGGGLGLGGNASSGGFQPIKTGYNINPMIMGLLQKKLAGYGAGLLGK